jgi:hypothetical protein
MPLVATELHRALGIAPTVLEQPEIVVAEGALYVTERATPQPAPAPPPRPAPAAPPLQSPQATFGAASPWASPPEPRPRPEPTRPATPSPPRRPAAPVADRAGTPTIRITQPPEAVRRRAVPGVIAGGVLLMFGLVGAVSAHAPAIAAPFMLIAGCFFLVAWRAGHAEQSWAEFGAEGIRRGLGNDSVLMPWSEIDGVERWKAGPVAQPSLVVVPSDRVVVDVREPWSSLLDHQAGGIRLGTLRELDTVEAEVLDAIDQTSPAGHRARRPA